MSNARPQLLIIGGGMAAARLLQRLVECGYPGSITVVGEEPIAAYNRVLLPGLLAGHHDLDDLTTHPPQWYATHGIRLMLGCPAVEIDLTTSRVRLADGATLVFDHLVLAVGARVPLPDIPGIHLPGVTVFRSAADARRLRLRAASGDPVVVVGGGLLGLETAQSLADLGIRVRVVHRHRRLLNRQLDEPAAAILASFLAANGVEVVLGAAPVALIGADRVHGVLLDSGRELAAGTVIFATGTAPNDELAARAGLACDNGILVDAAMRAEHPHVFAIGECARPAGRTFALVEPAYLQAEAVARTLTERPATFVPPPPASRLKVSGLEVFSAGQIEGEIADDTSEIRVTDPARGIYRRLIFRDSRLIGAVLVGDAAGSHRITQLIGTRAPITLSGDTRNRIAFGLEPAMASPASDGTQRAA